jgi:hypothetical protein
VESECSTTSTDQSSLGRPYTPSLPDDASDAAPTHFARIQSVQKYTRKTWRMCIGSGHWIKCASCAGGICTMDRFTDYHSLASLIMKSPPLYDPVRMIVYIRTHADCFAFFILVTHDYRLDPRWHCHFKCCGC